MKIYDNINEAAKSLKSIHTDSELLHFCIFYKRVGITCKIIDNNNRLQIVMSDGAPILYNDETIDKRLKGKKVMIIFSYSGKYIEQYA